MTTSPSSPKPSSLTEPTMENKSQSQSRVDEEIAAEMDCRGLKYRHGWPNLPSLPVRTIEQGAAQSLQNSAQHLENAQRALDAQGIESVVSFVYRMPLSARKAEMQDYLTLLVTTDTEAHAAERFHDMVIMLRRQLMDAPETATTKIEIIDHRATHGLTSHTVGYGARAEIILDKWDDVLEFTIKVIRDMGQEWQVIEFLRRGLHDDDRYKNDLTVVISTHTADDLDWWRTVRPALREGFLSMELGFDVDFEIAYCGSLYGVDEF